jgi:hypothetical protein
MTQQQMDAHEAMSQRYLLWNVERQGEDQSRKSEQSYWWRGPIWYDGAIPCTRFVQGARGRWFLLTKHTGPTIRAKDFNNSYSRLVVPDIGVFSRYEDDWLPEADMHERLRYIMLQQVREFTELRIECHTDKTIAEQPMTVSSNRAQLSQLYIKYEDYAKHFDLGWGKLPGMYMDGFDEAVRIKAGRWNDPDAVRRRERAKARKLASKALDLDAN